MVWVGAALAAVPLPPLVPEPAVTAWEGSAALAGGVEGSSAGTWPLADLSHGIGGGGTAPNAAWHGRLHGSLRTTTATALAYAETLRAGVALPGGAGLLGSVSVGGSPGWSETAVQGQWSRHTVMFDIEAAAGPALRGEAGRATTGAAVDVGASWSPSPRATLGAWSSGRSWLTIHAPGLSAQGGVYATGLARLDTRLTVAAGARGSTPSDDPYAEWAGLPAPGEAELWLAGRAAWQPKGPVAWVAEGGGRSVVGSPGEGWILVGAEGRLGGIKSRAPAVAPVTFRLAAPTAEDVCVVGSFNGWQREPMHKGADGTWTLARTVPPGSHEYSYIVDGVPRVPPEARRVVPDGFGGDNGVFEVPG